MGFNFGAFLGGAATQLVKDLDKKFIQRDRLYDS